MPTTCPACGTENRPFSKFCIECIATLPTSFAPTEFSPRIEAGGASRVRAAPSSAASIDGPPVSPAGLADAPSTRIASRGRAAPTVKKGLWVSVAAFAIALVVGAGGWLIAGAGGWYIYSSKLSPSAPAHSAVVENTAPSVQVVASAAPLAVAPVAPAAPVTPVVPALAAEPPLAKALADGAAHNARSARTPSTPAPAPAPAAHHAAPKAPAVPAVVRPAPVADPRPACAGRGFFAMASCMAAQCAEPAHRQHPECEAVRRQQRLMEEKRNPTLAN